MSRKPSTAKSLILTLLVILIAVAGLTFAAAMFAAAIGLWMMGP